eukprot:CAMPEP_0205821604 /NCGR_PEP_ID=MMETSP0206-20130828/8542_1 /ASSEMBLY_ACC=CAM_ASM_000279 /TAXON_ID=36767 /ORGANISM="Euplotes focardii, Strain TN1" /LENGTH=290 /DNA_ID=CAMNT_0053117199 /DNA_START=347 /DNA_END=1216 /DNA_ORIENTATION=+
MTATCESNICVASTGDDSACDTNKDCPLTHLCTGTRNKKCIALPKTGEVCTDTVGCFSNAICAMMDGDTDLKCTELFSVENGKVYTLANEVRPTPAAVFASNLCADGHAFPIGAATQSQCRPANRNKATGIKGLAKDEAGSECTLITRVAPETENWETESDVANVDSSKCGFNKDEKSYCSVQFGDEDILKIMRSSLENKSKRMCHRETGNPTEGSYCADQKKFDAADNAFQIYKTTGILVSSQASANVINNDRCVAETIMADFWQGNFDSAFTAGIIAVFSSFVAITLF